MRVQHAGAQGHGDLDQELSIHTSPLGTRGLDHPIQHEQGVHEQWHSINITFR